MTEYDPFKLIDHLKDKWGDRPCPMWGATDWSLPATLYRLVEFNEGLIFGGHIIPIVPIMCTNCGNTQLVNAIIAGATKAKDKSE